MRGLVFSHMLAFNVLPAFNV